MNFLLDTHTFLWTISGSDNIPAETKATIVDPANEIYVSAVSFWEIAIKTRLKKLDLGSIALDALISYAEEMEMQLIELTPVESISSAKLEENSHFDPFDRMLIWQSIHRNLIFISKDKTLEKFKKYGLKLFWQ